MRWRKRTLGSLLVVLGCGPSTGGPAGESATTTTASSSTGAPAEPTDAASASGAGSGGSLDTSGGNETGPSLEPGCFPESGHGDPISEHSSGLRIYAACSEDAVYFIEHPGDALVDTIEGVNAVRDASVSGLLDVPGLSSVGTGLCCGTPCIVVTVQAFDFSFEPLLASLAQEFPEADGQCFGIDVQFIGDVQPRCEATDPKCLPIPVCNGFQDGDGLCCNAPDYDPTAPRIPVGDDLSEGDCTHDGDCVLRGAGNHCMNWQSPGFVGLAVCYPELSQAFCGCVDGGCHWFDLG